MNGSKEILIFGGTTEGRKLAALLSKSKISCTVCVATEYGEMVQKREEGPAVHKGRMTKEQMQKMVSEKEVLAVVDATHPYATDVSRNIKESLKESEVPYLRLKRDTSYEDETLEKIEWFPDITAVKEALNKTEGNILLTTGSKELHVLADSSLKERLYVRVLPGIESISLCEEQGIKGRQIIAMQGPFSADLNQAVMEQYEITCLVTKESGAAGGFLEKLEAACRTGTKVFVIGNPEKEEEGASYYEVSEKLFQLVGCALPRPEYQISLIGMGMGTKAGLTIEASEALTKAEIVFGPMRLLSQVKGDRERYPYYIAKDIIPKIKAGQKEQVAILFSGDTGFYSGAKKMYSQLVEEISQGNLCAKIRILPGISSLAYLAAKTGINWEDAAIASIHGRKADIPAILRKHDKAFVLVSGVEDMQYLGGLFDKEEWEGTTITAGYQLSYEEEEIRRLTPKECRTLSKEGLYSCFIERGKGVCESIQKLVTHGFADDEFLRGKVPMTKEEIRDISICKLKLTEDAVFYDVGSGTGSIAVECAGRSRNLRVFAIEQKEEAVDLIRKNCEKFCVSNITVIQDKAPGALRCLPSPTHVFIGGSSGQLREILEVIFEKNPSVRVVLNAITLETIGKVMEMKKEFSLMGEVIQVQVSRAFRTGDYHLMRSENPVYIFTLYRE